MNVLQLFYTSCRKGLSSGSGFQTYAMSDGISEEERKEIERYGVYVAPIDLPPQPKKDEIETLFPVSFSFVRLSSGRHCICRSKYVGQDYSGRYGNYFCHALVMEAGYWPFYPIQLWGSSIFREGLTEEELGTTNSPEPLSPLKLDDVKRELSGEINFENVAMYAGEKRLEDLKEILSSLLLHEKTHRRLVLCDADENIPYWMASVQMAFTIKLAHQLTFTTYTHDPEGMNYLMTSTSRNGGRFAFSDTQRDYEYYIFDFIQEEKSAVEGDYKFNEIVEVGYSFSEANLKEFHEFLDSFENYDSVNGEIDAAHYLFEISRIGIGDLDVEAVVAAVSFANSYASPRMLGELSDNIEQVAAKISMNVTFKIAEVMTEFLFKAARENGASHHVLNAYAFFFTALDHLIVSAEEPDKNSSTAFHNVFMMLNREHREELRVRLLDPSRLGTLSEYLSNNRINDEKRCSLAEIYFTMVVNSVIEMGLSWEKAASREFAGFLRDCFNAMADSQRSLTAVLKCISKSERDFTRLVAFALSETCVDRKLLQFAFSKALQDKNGGSSDRIRSDLVMLGQGEFIFEEFKVRLEKEKFTPDFFWLYQEKVFSKIPEFSAEYFDRSVRFYVANLNSRQSRSEFFRLLECHRQIKDDVLLKSLVETWEQYQTPSPSVNKKKNSLIRMIKESRRIKTTPDITGMITYGNNLQESIKGKRECLHARPDLDHIDHDRYVKFLKWILPMMLLNIDSPEAHRETLEYLLFNDFELDVIDRYAACMKKDIKRRRDEGIEVVFNFVIFFLSLDCKKDETFKILKEPIEKNIINILSTIPNKKLKEFQRNILRYGKLNEAKKKKWLDMLKEAKELTSQPIFNKVFNLFKAKRT